VSPTDVLLEPVKRPFLFEAIDGSSRTEKYESELPIELALGIWPRMSLVLPPTCIAFPSS
jgi:hypothetical protein